MKISDLSGLLKDELAFHHISEDGSPSELYKNESADREIKDVAYDSRNVKDGFVFAAAVGALTDGHKYIPKAVENGAAAVICEVKDEYEKYSALYPGTAFFMVKSSRIALAVLSAEFFGRPADRMTLIGLTGTKGKTSTSFMIAGIFEEAGIKCGIIGTTGIYYDGKYEYIDNSTPESYELHRIFADMLSHGVSHCVMEVSSQALMLHRVHGLHFETAVFTNISPDHIGEGEHKSFEEYLGFKGRLFTMCSRAVINADSDRIDYIEDIIKENGVPCVKYSCTENTADYHGKDERFYIDGEMKTQYTLVMPDMSEHCVNVLVPGKFSVYNSLCALSAALSHGIDVQTAINALAKVKVIGRTEPVHHPKADFPIIIDYAHNALSLESLFNAIRAYSPSRIICVFGCGGNRSKLRRYDMGEISGRYASLSVITSDNPRDEELDDIIGDILVGMKRTNGNYVIIKDRREAIYYALGEAKAGDIVILAGKGQQDYEEIKGEKYPFNERLVVKDFFDERM